MGTDILTKGSARYTQIGKTKKFWRKVREKRTRSSSRVPREAAAGPSTAAAAPSTAAAAATVPSALLPPSHCDRRSKGACLGRADVLVAPRCAVVVEVALTCFFRF